MKVKPGMYQTWGEMAKSSSGKTVLLAGGSALGALFWVGWVAWSWWTTG